MFFIALFEDDRPSITAKLIPQSGVDVASCKAISRADSEGPAF